MQVQKPDDVLLGQAYHTLNGQPYVFLTVAYLCTSDGQLINEQQAWPWLATQENEEPFDYGIKKARGTYGVTGCAYSPNGQAVKSMYITVKIGHLSKQLVVYGDRFWQKNLGFKPSSTNTFTTMPVNLSHAFGGAGSPENVYGKGWPDDGSEPLGRPLPNIELIDSPILSIDDTPPVATFGVLSASGKTRSDFLGTLDDQWLKQDFPWVPRDSQPGWFDLVPADQHIDTYWQGTESWSVTGMHPEKKEIAGTLPALRPRLLIRQALNNDDTQLNNYEASLDLDTVWLYPEQQRVLLMYRAAIAVAREDGEDIKNIAVVTENQSQPAQTTAALMAQWQIDKDLTATENYAADMAGFAAGATTSRDFVADIEIPDPEQTDAAIIASVDSSFDEGLQERERVINEVLKNQPDLAKADLPAPVKPDFAALMAAQVAQTGQELDLANLQANITQDVLAELKQGQQLAKEKIDQAVNDAGLPAEDFADLMTKPIDVSANPQSGNLSAVQALNEIDLPDDIKSDLLKRAGDFDNKMLSVDSQLADVRAQIDKLYASLPGVYGGIMGALKLGEKLNAEMVLNHFQENDKQLIGAELIGLDFSGKDLSQADFTGAQIVDCNFNGAKLTSACFAQARVEKCNFNQADLSATDWQDADINACQFDMVNASKASFARATIMACTMNNADFTSSNWQQANLGDSSLNEANFSGSSLKSTTIWQSSACLADFSNCTASDIRIDTNCVFKQASFNNTNINQASIQDTDFSKANFNQAKFNNAYMARCDLNHTTAQQIEAVRTVFKDNNIQRASWLVANLMQASFEHTKIQDSIFDGSNLYAIDTRSAVIENVSVQEALVSRSQFDPDFKRAI